MSFDFNNIGNASASLSDNMKLCHIHIVIKIDKHYDYMLDFLKKKIQESKILSIYIKEIKIGYLDYKLECYVLKFYQIIDILKELHSILFTHAYAINILNMTSGFVFNNVFLKDFNVYPNSDIQCMRVHFTNFNIKHMHACENTSPFRVRFTGNIDNLYRNEDYNISDSFEFSYINNEIVES